LTARPKRGALSFAALKDGVLNTLTGTAGIFMVVIGTVLLARLMALSGAPGHIAGGLMALAGDQLAVIMMVLVLYLILGCFLDSIGILLLTLPIILPVARQAGIDLIWFGIILVKLLEIGLVTPSGGVNVYVMKGALGNLIPLPVIFRGVAWFVATDMVVLGVLVAFPSISLFLPGLME
jgi:TRAP-type C4-dicarboxylate transport system permease large subunit